MVAISGQFSSFNALLNLKRAQEGQTNTIARLSNGERIQSAHEDPSGLELSNNLRSDIRSLMQNKRAHFDGVTAIQLADESLEEVTNSLARIGELATQAASETMGGDNSPPKLSLDLEYQELLAEIDDLNNHLKFNNVTLFTSGGVSFVVNATPHLGNSATEEITVTFSSFTAADLGLAGTDLRTLVSSDAVLTTVEAALETISRQRGRLGAVQTRLIKNMDAIDDNILGTQEQEVTIRETEVAEETVNLAKYQILNQSNIAVLGQANLNVDQVLGLLS